ncbi:hypothetical protein [Streptomyces justiciae]|uniref:hypothetical protein n=1 Tax=Streptomyces justiciae TaxID=2780140 RepID=UPI002117F3F0|nr:hypothetical protein [Streptomyces justiciae]MCW8380787.1 hypothetical protein [Streptomyces justiciae]
MRTFFAKSAAVTALACVAVLPLAGAAQAAPPGHVPATAKALPAPDGPGDHGHHHHHDGLGLSLILGLGVVL